MDLGEPWMSDACLWESDHRRHPTGQYVVTTPSSVVKSMTTVSIDVDYYGVVEYTRRLTARVA